MIGLNQLTKDRVDRPTDRLDLDSAFKQAPLRIANHRHPATARGEIYTPNLQLSSFDLSRPARAELRIQIDVIKRVEIARLSRRRRRLFPCMQCTERAARRSCIAGPNERPREENALPAIKRLNGLAARLCLCQQPCFMDIAEILISVGRRRQRAVDWARERPSVRPYDSLATAFFADWKRSTMPDVLLSK